MKHVLCKISVVGNERKKKKREYPEKHGILELSVCARQVALHMEQE